jgi:Secretion system C-terminal sorting domain
MKYLPLVLLIISSLRGFSQASVYHPFSLDKKTEWRTDYFSNDCIDQAYALCYSIRHYSEGDSIVDSLKYTKIYNDGIGYFPDTVTYQIHSIVGLIREDTFNKKLYFIFDGSSIEYLLYDFDLFVGDTVVTFLNVDLVVASIDSILLGNEYHKKINFDNSFPHLIFIVEGLGSQGGLFTELYDGYGFEAAEVLKCFKVNDTILYEDSSYYFTECNLSYPSYIEENAIVELSIFPNPAVLNQNLFISGDLCKGCTISIYNSMGKPIFLDQDYNKSTGIYLKNDLFSPGIYMLKIQANNTLFKGIKICIL